MRRASDLAPCNSCAYFQTSDERAAVVGYAFLIVALAIVIFERPGANARAAPYF